MSFSFGFSCSVMKCSSAVCFLSGQKSRIFYSVSKVWIFAPKLSLILIHFSHFTLIFIHFTIIFKILENEALYFNFQTLWILNWFADIWNACISILWGKKYSVLFSYAARLWRQKEPKEKEKKIMQYQMRNLECQIFSINQTNSLISER